MIDFSLLIYYLVRCFILTIIIEMVAAFILRIKDKKDYLNIFLVNLMTNPILNINLYILTIMYGTFYYYKILIVLELLAFISEGFIYKKYLKYKRISPYLLSLILNLCSYFIGNIINTVL